MNEDLREMNQVPHDSQGGHVQGDPGAGLELGLVELPAASDHVARSVGGLHDEVVVGQLPQNLADDLADALKGLQVILRLV